MGCLAALWIRRAVRQASEARSPDPAEIVADAAEKGGISGREAGISAFDLRSGVTRSIPSGPVRRSTAFPRQPEHRDQLLPQRLFCQRAQRLRSVNPAKPTVRSRPMPICGVKKSRQSPTAVSSGYRDVTPNEFGSEVASAGRRRRDCQNSHHRMDHGNCSTTSR